METLSSLLAKAKVKSNAFWASSEKSKGTSTLVMVFGLMFYAKLA
jgi:hypothetical protein